MKLLFMFDSSASSYEVKNELSLMSGWPGIQSVQLLEKISGEAARYCAEIDVADDQAELVRDRARGIEAQYAGYVFGFKELAYRTV